MIEPAEYNSVWTDRPGILHCIWLSQLLEAEIEMKLPGATMNVAL